MEDNDYISRIQKESNYLADIYHLFGTHPTELIAPKDSELKIEKYNLPLSVNYGDSIMDNDTDAEYIPKFDSRSDSWVTSAGSSYKCKTITNFLYDVYAE